LQIHGKLILCIVEITQKTSLEATSCEPGWRWPAHSPVSFDARWKRTHILDARARVFRAWGRFSWKRCIFSSGF